MTWVGMDVDGTILDTWDRHRAVLAEVAEGTEDIADAWQELKRSGKSSSAALVELGWAPTAAQRIHDAWVAAIEEPRFCALDRPFPDTPSVLAGLAASGINVIAVSARQARGPLVATLRESGIDLDLRVVAPGPGADLRKAEEVTDLERPILVVGDSEVDLGWARALEVPFHALSTGARSEAFWSANAVGTPVYTSLTTAIGHLLGASL